MGRRPHVIGKITLRVQNPFGDEFAAIGGKVNCVLTCRGGCYDCFLSVEEGCDWETGEEVELPITFIDPHHACNRVHIGSRFELLRGKKVIAEGEVLDCRREPAHL